MTERTRDFPVCVFGIHKAGAAYLPLDPAYPTDRLSYMLKDSGTRILVTTHALLDAKRHDDGLDVENVSVIYIDDINWEGDAAKSKPVNRCTPDGYTYIIYTSGSTGRPKGAVLHQKGLLNYVFSTIDELGLTSDDRISSHRSFSFDSHIEDLYPILLLGGSLHIMPEIIRKDLHGIYEFIVAHRVTGGGYPTSIAKLLVNTFDLPLRYVSAIGERLTGVVSRTCKIFNFYGPTECTDHISVYLLQQNREYENIPIGHVVANNWCFIVDTHDRLLPRGVVGELCIAGIQVGIGYWQRPELTAEKFVDCPFLRPFGSKRPEVERVTENIDGTPVRMYRTGDLCRWNADGDLEYIGRIDNQVKLRGYRVELGEIENCASRFEGISLAVAAIRPIRGTDTLCLYYTSVSDIDEQSLRDHLSRLLAEYMVPTAYMQLDALPLLPNGKVDRRRLPAIEQSLLHTDYVAPRNELEKLIVSGFEKVLNQEKISVNDDFVQLGGDSLSALKLVFSLGKSGITVADVLSLRTPAAIASNTKHISVNLNRYSIESGCPLNNTQMFIFQDIVKFNKYDSYLMPSLIPIDRKYTDEQIRRALDVMFTVHPVLTMHVAMRDGVPYMEKGDKPAVMKGSLNPLKLIKLLTSGFDLYSSLSRHVIVRIPGRCYLLSVIHHLIFDVVSTNVFCRHFLRALEGETLDFVDDHFLQISAFHQEVRSTEQYAEMDKYISSMLSNLTEANFYRNLGKKGKPGYHKRELGVDREQVNRFTERYDITKNILFTAAMAMTLSKLAGNDEVAFGFLDNGRDRFNNFEDLGLYITGMPLVAHVDHHDMRAYLNNLSDVYYKLSQNSYFPFATLVQEFNIAPIILFQFFPDWITEDGKYNHLPHNETLTNTILSTQKDFMVEALVDVNEMKDCYMIEITYSGYYSRKMMKALAATYKKTLSEMVKVES
jgi:amino acid adenylation domain-containing protein